MNREDYRERSAGRVVRTHTGYWAFIPAPLPPDIAWSPSILSILLEAERNLGRLASLGGELPLPDLLVQPFVRREAVLSSRIEGTHASLTDLYSYEAKQLHLFEDLADAQEVHNYVEALNTGLSRLARLPVSLRLIREIHLILMTGVRGGAFTPGEFRRSQNWIGPTTSTIESAL